MSKDKTPTGEPSPEECAKELDALMNIIRALKSVGKDERARILRYARDKFGIYMGDT